MRCQQGFQVSSGSTALGKLSRFVPEPQGSTVISIILMGARPARVGDLVLSWLQAGAVDRISRGAAKGSSQLHEPFQRAVEDTE